MAAPSFDRSSRNRDHRATLVQALTQQPTTSQTDASWAEDANTEDDGGWLTGAELVSQRQQRRKEFNPTGTARVASNPVVHSEQAVPTTPAPRSYPSSPPQQPSAALPLVPTHPSPPEGPQVPTWVGRPFGRRDGGANKVGVARPRLWGAQGDQPPFTPPRPSTPFEVPTSEAPVAESSARSPPHAEEAADNTEDDAWNEPSRLQQWVEDVVPVPPPDAVGSPILEKATSESSLSRPNSVPPVLKPATVFYSDDEHSVPPLSPDIKVEPLPDHPVEDFSPVPAAADADDAEVTLADPTALIQEGDHREPRASIQGNDIDRKSGIHSATGTDLYHRRREQTPGKGAKWWKREPHPMYSPQFASRRLMIRLPFPIRRDHFKQVMYDHFTRYGSIRCVLPYEYEPQQVEKAFIVFNDEASLQKCLEDPQRSKCEYRSHSRSPNTTFEMEIRHLPPESQTRTIWVKLTGPRHDARSRSASPPVKRKVQSRTDEPTFDTSPLPSYVDVFAFPAFPQRTPTQWFPRLIIPGVTDMSALRRAHNETGKEPIRVDRIDLSRRMAEKDIIPRLVDDFVEIVDVVPPTSLGQGWLVTVAGTLEARHLMHQLSGIPGVSVRWGNEQDGIYAGQPPSPILTNDHEVQSPITRVKEEMTGIRPLQSRLGRMKIGSISIPPDQALSKEGNLTPPPSPRASQKTSKEALVTNHSPGSETSYPGLSRHIIFTYKGRPLREDTSSGDAKYIDDSAIFVGRLVKGQETPSTLLKRFEKYGKISAIEYNPNVVQTTYVTARVLYQDPESAARAVEHENGAVSNGSALKVEPRRVLALDVQAREMYMDDYGRAISPSMASQYTPPSPKFKPMIDIPVVPTQPAVPIPPHFPQVPQFAPIGAPVMPPMATTANGYIPIQPTMPGQWLPPQMYQPQQPPPPVYPMAHGWYGVPPGADSNVAQAAPVHPPEQQPLMMPVMWQLGFGYCPPPPTFAQYNAAAQQPIPSQPPTHEAADMTPPSAPPFAAASTHTAPILSPPPPPPPMPLTSPMIHASYAAEASVVSPAPHSPPSSGNRSNPRFITAKLEDGMFKPIYDPEDMAMWRRENNVPEDQLPMHQPKSESPITLLPITTGGHDFSTSAISPVSVGPTYATLPPPLIDPRLGGANNEWKQPPPPPSAPIPIPGRAPESSEYKTNHIVPLPLPFTPPRPPPASLNMHGSPENTAALPHWPMGAPRQPGRSYEMESPAGRNPQHRSSRRSLRDREIYPPSEPRRSGPPSPGISYRSGGGGGGGYPFDRPRHRRDNASGSDIAKFHAKANGFVG